MWVFGVLLGMGLNPRGLEAGAGASPSASEEAWLTSQQQHWATAEVWM